MNTTETIPGKFLGAMGGTPILTLINGEKVDYSREYKPGCTNKLRKKISKVGRQGWEELGKDYNYTPLCFWDGRAFNTESSSKIGGGYFISKVCDPEKIHFNCFQYAISSFRKELEKVAGKTLFEIRAMDIEDIVYSYFKKAVKPKDGNLAIYWILKGGIEWPLGKINTGITHAGIYRKTLPNWNSPHGGTIESKWGFNSRKIFEHDVFFAPHFYGNTVKFYELNKVENALPNSEVNASAALNDSTLVLNSSTSLGEL